jgi:hypothetical protein
MELKPRDLIARYIAGVIGAAELEDRLEDVAWGSDSNLASLALRLLHEYTNGDWIEDELRERLDAFARTYEQTFVTPNRTGVSADTMVQALPARVETRRVAVSV